LRVAKVRASHSLKQEKRKVFFHIFLTPNSRFSTVTAQALSSPQTLFSKAGAKVRANFISPIPSLFFFKKILFRNMHIEVSNERRDAPKLKTGALAANSCRKTAQYARSSLFSM
jgi:hypothetical protein